MNSPSMIRKPAVEVNGVTFSYTTDIPVLININLTFYRGELVTIIGQNGSGKTTFTKLLNNLLTPDQGEIRLFDRKGNAYLTHEYSISKLASLVGYVFQNPDDQIFQTTIFDEISTGLKNIGVPSEEHKQIVDEVLATVDLHVDPNSNPFKLGKGERQRLAIAAILAMQPQILCVDEPTTGQDKREGARIMDILTDYADQGNTVLAITHDMALAAEYTDRVVVMDDGRITDVGTPVEVFANEQNLLETNIRPPQITQLRLELEKKSFLESECDIWLTVDDAYSALLSEVGK